MVATMDISTAMVATAVVTDMAAEVAAVKAHESAEFSKV